jgi:apolipoprotein D and lipocalin family protein
LLLQLAAVPAFRTALHLLRIRRLTGISASGINVLNRGYDPEKQKWKEAEGRGYFIGDRETGRLKVSFFWPFYGGYNIIELDKTDYQYALVCGPDRSYLWILARTPGLDPAITRRLVSKARELGFETDKLIYVKYDL